MSSAKRSHQGLVVAEALIAASISVSTLFLTRKYLRRQQRTKLIQQDNEDDKEQDTIPSIIAAFESMQLDDNFTVEEANKRRTGVYYERARDAHEYDLCPGVRSYPRLRNRREAELKRIFRYHNEGNKSHRTIIVMLDNYSASILLEARHSILAPLNYSTFIETTGVWIPECNLLPREDLHVTVAIPWWWHTIRDQNRELSQELVARFRSALVYEFHHPFQIELERIVLLGGKALVALWRTVGERKADDGVVTIYDRHGETIDPFVKLRADIVKCFSGSEEILGPPLTYSTRHVSVASPAPIKQNLQREEAFVSDSIPPIPPPAMPSSRQNTIELKTPGLGQHDGFIHTTLARLPLDCLSMSDVELAPIHRLCREATATYCGHRMAVSKFRFLETTGAGGESNPCTDPIFDETIESPIRVEVGIDGAMTEQRDLHVGNSVERSSTIGALPNIPSRAAIEGLFDGLAEGVEDESGQN